MREALQQALTLFIVLFTLCVTWDQSAAQAFTDICLKNGVTIHAADIKTRESGFLILPRGRAAFLDIPADQVTEIGAACAGTPPASPAAPQPAGPAGAPSGFSAILQPAPAQPEAPPTDGPAKITLRGSALMGDELLPALVGAYGRRRGWTAAATPEDAGGRQIALTAPGAAGPAAVIRITPGDPADAVRGLADGETDIAMFSRRMSPEEASTIEARRHVNLLTPEAGAEYVAALDAVAILVNKDNPVRRLSFDQIARVFSGEIVQWKDLRGLDDEGRETAGPDGPIRLNIPDPPSDRMNFFKTMVMAPAHRELSPKAARRPDEEDASRAVAEDVNAIGLASFARAGANPAISISTPCGLTGVLSSFSVKSEDYPLSRRLYLYAVGGPKQRLTQDFLSYAVSNEAQEIIRSSGFFDHALEMQTPQERQRWIDDLIANPMTGVSPQARARAERTAGDEGEPDEADVAEMQKNMDIFSQLTVRTSVVFRFEPYGAALDSRAQHDLARLAQAWKALEIDDRYLLVGFADWDGGEQRNAFLTLSRARSVWKALDKLGAAPGDMATHTAGLSSTAPVACNDSPAGKAKNRRVELWLFSDAALASRKAQPAESAKAADAQ